MNAALTTAGGAPPIGAPCRRARPWTANAKTEPVYGGAARRQRRLVRRARRRRAFLLLCAAGLLGIVLLTFLRPDGVPLSGDAGVEEAEGPPYEIALDAGHGGRDQGAEGLIPEVFLTEETVAVLGALLDADPDFRLILCREAGRGASIEERAAAARNAGADLLLSVHGNADLSAAASGFECFPVPPGRTRHAESYRFARLLATEMAAAGSALRGEGGVRFAYFDSEGERFFRETDDTTVHAEKSFAILELTECPAVLAEQCFLTNPSDVEAFGTAEGCQKAAAAYYRAIRRYYHLEAEAAPAQPEAPESAI
jgi:N-acetylmuramoyl-L-alanine amidase